VLLWFAGRVAIFAAGFLGVFAAVIDAAFLIVLAGVAWREVISGRNLRNVPICVMVSLFALTNLAFHADPMMPGAADYAIRGALGLILLLISLIGGRVVPSFTRNWLAKAGATAMPAPFGDFDKLSLFVTALAVLAWTIAPESGTTAGLFAAAAALQAIRLTRWQGLAARREPLLLVLHVAYAWLPVAMALLAAGVVWPEIGASPGIHAFTAGGIGMMTLAVMTRATLGHTGRALTAGTSTNAIYLLVFAGAVIRVAAFWLPFDYVAVITLAGAMWSAGFLLFVWVYGPMLVGPNARRG